MTKKLSRQEIKQRRAVLKQAKRALDASAEREKSAGIREETPEFQRLNRKVNDALNALPWWAR